MIQNSNNRPAGSNAIQCDAGTPIMGRTSDTGTYQVLKVNADGSIAGLPSPVADASVLYSLSPGVIPSILGAFAGGVAIDYVDVITTSISAGSYTIAPWYGLEATTSGGSISIGLVKVGSNMDTYCTGLNLGTDAYQPPVTLAWNGLAQFWHNIPIEPLGSLAGASFIVGNQQVMAKSVYLETGTYKLIVICHTAFTKGSPFSIVGLSIANG